MRTLILTLGYAFLFGVICMTAAEFMNAEPAAPPFATDFGSAAICDHCRARLMALGFTKINGRCGGNSHIMDIFSITPWSQPKLVPGLVEEFNAAEHTYDRQL